MRSQYLENEDFFLCLTRWMEYKQRLDYFFIFLVYRVSQTYKVEERTI